jgi:hypothetical protein
MRGCEVGGKRWNVSNTNRDMGCDDWLDGRNKAFVSTAKPRVSSDEFFQHRFSSDRPTSGSSQQIYFLIKLFVTPVTTYH